MPKSSLLTNTAICPTIKNQSIDEALHRWNDARATFATSLQMYLGAFSHFEIACAQFFESKELDIVGPDVRATLDEEILSTATHGSSIARTETRLLRLKNMSTIISPIRKLPAEILARVFLFAVDSYRTIHYDPIYGYLLVNQVDAISGVCSYWRRVSLSNCQIWSYLDVYRLRDTDYLSLWLERAGNRPLDITDVIPFDHPRVECGSLFSLVFSRIKCVHSMILGSDEDMTQEWISEWCSNGTPRTLTTLALQVPYREMVEFPANGKNITQQHLDELFHSLDTLYLNRMRVNWALLKCHNLVTLALLDLKITLDALRQILASNPHLQYIHLSVDITDASEPTTLPLIQLPSLHTLHLNNIESFLFGTVAPGNCELNLRIDTGFSEARNDVFGPDFSAFCRRSHITKLYCRSRYVLEYAIIAESRIKILCLEDIKLDHHIYDLIVPPITHNPISFSEHPQSRLPHLKSLYIAKSELSHPEGFRRVISTGSMREIGIDQCCRVAGKRLFEAEELEDWLGPVADVAIVIKEKEEAMGYTPFYRC